MDLRRKDRWARRGVLALAVALSSQVEADTIVWDFEGGVAVENDPVQDRLYDQSGRLKFRLVTPAGGDTFDRFTEGVPSNPVRYDAINDESAITPTPGGGANDWLLRSDWSFDGSSHSKRGDGDTGAFVSDSFFIDENKIEINTTTKYSN